MRRRGAAWGAALLLAPICAQAQDLDAARAFTLGLYRAYRGREPDYLGRDAPATFAPRLLALLRQDRASAAPGDVGLIDWDPICNCQDDEGLKVARLTLRATGPRQARADLVLRFVGDSQALSLDLAATPAGWRVADVRTRDAPSLVRRLEVGLRPLRKSSRTP